MSTVIEKLMLKMFFSLAREFMRDEYKMVHFEVEQYVLVVGHTYVTEVGIPSVNFLILETRKSRQ